jgi:hypothetical protein
MSRPFWWQPEVTSAAMPQQLTKDLSEGFFQALASADNDGKVGIC